MSKKKKKTGSSSFSVDSTIHKLASSDSYYITWSASSGARNKKIHKKIYNPKSKHSNHMDNKTSTYAAAISGYHVSWYYRIKDADGNTLTILDKDSDFGSSASNSESDLYSPPEKSTGVVSVITPKSKQYRKNKKGDKANWFKGVSDRSWINTDGSPDVPQVETFTILDKLASVKVSFDVDDPPGYLRIQFLRDESSIGSPISYTLQPADKEVGFYIFKPAEFTELGKYQVRASAGNLGLKSKIVYSNWTDWSSGVNTKPASPELISCEATADDKIKVTWGSVSNVKSYKVEYVEDSAQNFENGSPSYITVEDSLTALLSNLTSGKTYYIRVKSVIDDNTESDPSAVKTAILGTKPSAPTTWSSSTLMNLSNSLETTIKEYLYWVHNSKDGSAQRSTELRFDIANVTYYLLVNNTNVDTYGNLIDETMQLELWSQVLYTTEGENATAAGTVYDLFKAGGGNTIKWKVRTKGIYAEYSDWSVERIIKAYFKPSLTISVTKDGSVLADNILTGYPFKIEGTAEAASQSPINYYVGIYNSDSYSGVNSYGESVTVLENSEVYHAFINPDESTKKLLLTLSASDVDLNSEIKYTIKAIANFDSGLSAEASYQFTPSWIESSDVPDAEITYNETYRYTKIRPYCEYYLGDSTLETEPNIYYGTGISGTSTEGTVFANSGVANALIGDFYFNNSLFTIYICTLAGDPATAKWSYKTAFDYSDSLTWYSGTEITVDNDGEPVLTSEVANAVVNDYYFNIDTGDVFKCYLGGAPSIAIWYYAWNVLWQTSKNTKLSVYRKNSDGSYTTIAEGIDNEVQSSDSALYVKDRHPSFGSCVYRIVSINTINSGLNFTDVEEDIEETSVVLQWNEDWSTDVNNALSEEYTGSILELPANIKISDSASTDVTLAEYIGRYRPVAYYGTQRGESLKISCEFPKEDTVTLDILRHLMVYAGNVYVREPSGIGYWANVTVSYDRDYKDLTIPVSLDVKAVEGGA